MNRCTVRLTDPSLLAGASVLRRHAHLQTKALNELCCLPSTLLVLFTLFPSQLSFLFLERLCHFELIEYILNRKLCKWLGQTLKLLAKTKHQRPVSVQAS